MSQLMEQVKSLLRDRRWLDVRAMEPALLAQSGDALIIAHAQLHVACVNSAAHPHDWRQARHHLYAILNMAPKASATYIWALQAVSAINVNLRRPHEAAVYAKAFLRQASRRGELQYAVPFAWQNLGAAATLLGQHQRAAQCYRIALSGMQAGFESEQQRIGLYLSWSLLRAGRSSEACHAMPEEPASELRSVWHAIRAYIAADSSDWVTAAQEATEALKVPWSPLDHIEAVEMCLLLAHISRRRGVGAEAISWTKKAVEFEARLDRGIRTRLVLATAAEGGDFLAAVASPGSGGYHPDACYSTGVGG